MSFPGISAPCSEFTSGACSISSRGEQKPGLAMVSQCSVKWPCSITSIFFSWSAQAAAPSTLPGFRATLYTSNTLPGMWNAQFTIVVPFLCLKSPADSPLLRAAPEKDVMRPFWPLWCRICSVLIALLVLASFFFLDFSSSCISVRGLTRLGLHT